MNPPPANPPPVNPSPTPNPPTPPSTPPPASRLATQRYPVQQWYGISALLCLGLGLVFGWQLVGQLRAGAEAGTVLFLGICLGCAVWQWRAARTRVMLDRDRMIVAPPWRAAHEIEFRQLLTVVQEGRVNPTLLVMYHPRGANGLVDPDAVQSVTLPGVQDQTALLDRLEGHIPR
ncbi:MAG: hypothetical protein WDZ49_17575 [Litorilinea sp.]